MHIENGPAPSLGLLHILEDTLSLMEGRVLDQKRRDYVLQEASELVSEAQEGSAVRQQEHLFVQPGKWRALESFTLLSRYLGEDKKYLDAKFLQEVATVLERLSRGEEVPAAPKKTAISTLRELCEHMSRDISDRVIGSSDDLPAFAG